MKKSIILFVFCILRGCNLTALAFPKDSIRLELIQKEMLECLTTLNNHTDYNMDSNLKEVVKANNRLNNLAQDYFDLTNDSSVFAFSFMAELLTAFVYDGNNQTESAYVHSQKALELYDPYGRMLCNSDTTKRWSAYVFGNDGLYGIMRDWYFDKGNLKEAIRYNTIITDSCKVINADIDVVRAYLRQAEMYEMTNDYKKSFELQIRALDTRQAYSNYGLSPLVSQIYVGILKTLEKIANKEKLLVNRESVKWITSDFGSFLDNFIKSHPIDFVFEEEKLGKTDWAKNLFYTYIRIWEIYKLYDVILSLEEGMGDFIERNYGRESTDYAEYLMLFCNIYNNYLKELDSDVEKEKYRTLAVKKNNQALETWKSYFEKNNISSIVLEYQKCEKELASQKQKKQETCDEVIRLESLLYSYLEYMNNVYSSCMETNNYEMAYDAISKAINLNENVLKSTGDASSYVTLGSVSIMKNDFINAEKYFNKAHSITCEKKDTLIMTSANLMLFKLYTYSFNNQVKARYYLNDAYKLITKYSYHSIEKAEVMKEMAGFYKSIHNYVIARFLIARSNLEKQWCGQSLTDEDYINEASYLLGQLLNDSLLFGHIKEIADKEIVSEQVQKASELLGLSYASSLTDYNEGIRYYQKAANTAHGLKDYISEARDIAEIGTILFAKKEYDKALKYIKKAENIESRLKCEIMLPLMAHINNDNIVKKRLPFLYDSTVKSLKKQLLSTNSKGRELMVGSMPYHVLKSMTYYYPHISICAQIAYNSTLLYKGLLLNTQRNVSEYVANSNDKNLIEKYNELQIIHDRKIYGSTFEESMDSQIKTTELELSILEDLSQKEVLADLEITWEDVREKLSKNDVAIEFIEINKQECFDHSAFCYGALLLRRDYKHPVFIELGSKQEIDKNIDALLHSFNYGIRQTASKWYAASEHLYALIWGKMGSFIFPGDNVYFSTDGLLHKTPIEFLSDSLGNYANETYNMFRLSSTRELCKTRKSTLSKAVLYGGILFDAKPKGKEVDSLDAFQPFEDPLTRSGWNYLPASDAEVDTISNILFSFGIPVIKRKGEDGTEESFKELSGTDLSILHIATHGFYFSQKEIQYLDYFQSQTNNTPPLRRSGLMMAGGQTAWLGEENIEQEHDGILTSEEISTIDFSNVSLAVLSACQTGLGDINNIGAEGVIGIQRAFKLAGVQSLLMSLWKVDDNSTSYLMQRFYSRMLSGETKHDAFKNAQREVRNKYPNPFYWAGFVMLD